MKQDLVLKITARLMQLEHGPFRRPPGSVQKMRKKNSKYKGGKIFHNINQKKKIIYGNFAFIVQKKSCRRKLNSFV